MIIERTLMALAAAAAIAAAAAVSVVSAAFAVFAVLRPLVGPAGASAIVAAVFAVVVALAGVLAAMRSGDKRRRHPHEPDAMGMVERVVGIAKRKPLIAAGAALAAGILAIRNPQLVATVVRAFVDGPPDPRRR